MNDQPKQLAPRALPLALMLICSACAGNAHLHEESRSLTDLPEVQMDDEIFNVSNSNKDEGNRYAAAVLVVSSGVPECTGALIHRRQKFTIEAPGSLALPGDSGGPCFREDGQGIALVGINSRSAPGKKSTFTSTYHYLKWLDAEIQRANQL